MFGPHMVVNGTCRLCNQPIGMAIAASACPNNKGPDEAERRATLIATLAASLWRTGTTLVATIPDAVSLACEFVDEAYKAEEFRASEARRQP